MSSNLVSIIIPVYNAERYLRQTIDSVLGQTYQDIEVVAVDDGSGDGSVEILRDYGESVNWFSQQNLGAAAARNAGVAASSGSYIAYLDADDYWHANKLELQLAWLRSEPDLGYVFTLLQQFICNSLNPSEAAALSCPSEPQAGYVPGTLLAHRRVIEQVGCLDTRYKVGEFIDWHARAIHLGIKSALMPKVMLYRRLHKNNVGRRSLPDRSDYARVAKAALMRRKDN